MTERFEIPPGRCRDSVWIAGSRAVCQHLDLLDGLCRLAPRVQLERGGAVVIRRTDGKCPYGDGCIRVTQEAAQRPREVLDRPMTLREYDAEYMAPLKYGPPTGEKP